MKKLLSVILSFIMIIACIPPIVLATDTANAESLYEYEINDGEVTITRYIGNETDVDIPSEIEGLPVTAIGEKAFYEYSLLENLNIPGTVETIGVRAFYRCNSLKTVYILDGVKRIDDMAFYSSGSCYNVILPSSIEWFGVWAFDGFTYRILYMGSLDQWENIKYEEDPYDNGVSATFYSVVQYYRELGISGITEDGFVYSISDASEVTIRRILDSSEDIVIPKTIEGLPVVAIGAQAFISIKAKNLYIHEGIKRLSKYSFFENDYGYFECTFVYEADIENIYYEGSPGMLNSLGAGNLSNSYNVIGDYEPIVGFALADGKTEITLSIGDTFEPVYEVYPENAKGVFEYSYDSDCISIKNGIITAKNAGETTVTVTAESGVTYTFKVKVVGAVGISVLNPPSKIYYGLRESLDVEGLKIIKQYNDGSFVEVTDYKISSFNPLQRGIQVITVTGESFTTTFNVFVTGALKGDADLDGMITGVDSNRIKRIIVGKNTVEEYTDEYFACDLNGDGEINAYDSALVKAKIVGK